MADDWMGAMYAAPEDEEASENTEALRGAAGQFVKKTEAEAAERVQMQNVVTKNQTVTIMIEGKPVVLPSMAFVQAQDRKVRALEQKILEQARLIRYLESQAKQLRMALNQHTNEMNEMQRELDRKVSF